MLAHGRKNFRSMNESFLGSCVELVKEIKQMKTHPLFYAAIAAGIFLTAGPAFANDKKDAESKKARAEAMVASKGARARQISAVDGARARGVSANNGARARDVSAARVYKARESVALQGMRQQRDYAVASARVKRDSVVAKGRIYKDSQQRFSDRGNNGGRSFDRSDRGSHHEIAFRDHDGWRHDRRYSWNGHHYGWYGGGWVIIDPDYYDGYYGPGYVTTTTYDNSYDNGSLPAQVQSALAREGYYDGDIDGDIGPASRSAIANYQRDNGLPVTGTITNSLLDSLGIG